MAFDCYRLIKILDLIGLILVPLCMVQKSAIDQGYPSATRTVGTHKYQNN